VPCSLVDVCQRFGCIAASIIITFHPDYGGQQVLPKCW
jgi:hypothetical protein